MENIFLLVGTNVGDLQSNISRAEDEVKKHNICILKKSQVLHTKPWGATDQPDFLNCVCEVSCAYSPDELLKVLKEIESAMGRTPGPRWGPRIIDIDILFYDQEIVRQPDLVIPHKDFARRPFAIQLLAEIAPDFVSPESGKRMQDYLKEIQNGKPAFYCS